eukprot:m.467113 g.467113  ORF g.467113 m.467113 type:complete len:401 (-) comp25919_c0_seq1:42-1244(-)
MSLTTFDEQQLDEIEALESIYGQDFTVVCGDPPRVLRLSLGNHLVVVTLPREYPTAPPHYEITPHKDGPTVHDVQKLAEIHSAADGEVCLYESFQWISEKFSQCPSPAACEEEVHTHQIPGVPESGATQRSGEGCADDECSELPVHLNQRQLAALMTSLSVSGFIACSREEHVHASEGITVIVSTTATVLVSAQGVEANAIAAFLALELEIAPNCAAFGARLIQAVKDMRHMASDGPGEEVHDNEDEVDESTAQSRCRAKLPSAADLSCDIWPEGIQKINSGRRIVIYTWGDALMKRSALKARGSQFDINAKPLSGRGGGADIRKYNALQDPKIMLNVASSLAEERGRLMLKQTVRKIEEEDLQIISTYCSKGRHRSVSLALLLKLMYYPHATIEHLTIK